jgi:hypothetical protein
MTTRATFGRPYTEKGKKKKKKRPKHGRGAAIRYR